MTDAVERSVTHTRLRSMTDAHPRDVTVALSSLVQKGILESAGAHKRTYYFLPGERPAAEATPVSFQLPLPGLEGGTSRPDASFEHKEPRSEHNGPSSEHNGPSSEHSGPSSEHSGLTPPLSSELESMAADLRGRKRAKPTEVEKVLLALCAGRFLALPDLARLTGRTYNTVRVHYIARLVENGSLELRYPDQPTHPGQAYRTVAGRGGGS